MFQIQRSLSEPDIVPPHDFEFQLHHYVLPPERSRGQRLIEPLSLGDGVAAVAEVQSAGSTRRPRLEVTIRSPVPLSDAQVSRVVESLSWKLSLREDLRPFYELVATDPVMQAAVTFQTGAKDKRASSMFDALVDAICGQQLPFQRLSTLMGNLADAFGDTVVIDGETYSLSPTAPPLALATEADIRACGVGYRARYLKAAAEAVAGGELDLDDFATLPVEEARSRLCAVQGVGRYTGDLTLVLGAGRRDLLHVDSFVRAILCHFYFAGAAVSDDELRAFAADRWGDLQGHAVFYLTTNTHEWSRVLPEPFRLKSAARSTP